MATLRSRSAKVCTKHEAASSPLGGDRLACKIEEIAHTNRVRELDNVQTEPKDKPLRFFMEILSSGFAQASKWVEQGFDSVAELLEKAKLMDKKLVSIAHYEDFISRIPLAEAGSHGAIVRTALQTIDPAFEVIAGASYRRGEQMSGDIDCIITRPSTR